MVSHAHYGFYSATSLVGVERSNPHLHTMLAVSENICPYTETAGILCDGNSKKLQQCQLENDEYVFLMTILRVVHKKPIHSFMQSFCSFPHHS